MADELKPTATATTAKSKSWKYVGPGNPGNKDKEMPTIGNLPLDPKDPKLGNRSGVFEAADLPEELIQYVMATNTTAEKWWVLE